MPAFYPAHGARANLAWELPMPIHRGSVPGQLSLEITQAVPVQTQVEVHFGDDDATPLFGLHDRLAIVTVDRRQHPIAGNILIRATHEIHMVFARTSAGQVGIAAPHRPGDDFGPAVA